MTTQNPWLRVEQERQQKEQKLASTLSQTAEFFEWLNETKKIPNAQYSELDPWSRVQLLREYGQQLPKD